MSWKQLPFHNIMGSESSFRITVFLLIVGCTFYLCFYIGGGPCDHFIIGSRDLVKIIMILRILIMIKITSAGCSGGCRWVPLGPEAQYWRHPAAATSGPGKKVVSIYFKDFNNCSSLVHIVCFIQSHWFFQSFSKMIFLHITWMGTAALTTLPRNL